MKSTPLIVVLDWRVRIIAWSVFWFAVGFAILLSLRGTPPDLGGWVLNFLVAAILALVANRGMSRSPRLLLSRLRALYFSRARPDVAVVNSILKHAGEAELFQEHRKLVDYAVRGLISDDAFHAEMRLLLNESRERSLGSSSDG